MIKKIMIWAVGAALLTGCGESSGLKVLVTNSTQDARTQEITEISAALVFERLNLNDMDQFVIYDEEGNEIPYQLTYDEKVIFPADVDSMNSVTYTFQKGEPNMVNTVVYGAQYPEWQDDLAWENDKSAYRVYGPDVQHRGQKSYGYDIFTKSVSDLVMEGRYGLLLNEETWKTIKELRKAGRKEEADSIDHSISYHVDHGTGMDCYQVGATLGAGTAALMNNDEIIYPYCYQDFEILDNGPLRYTMRLKFTPLIVKNDSNVIETRIIQLDKGSYLNKTTVNYENLTDKQIIAVGQAIHMPFTDRYKFNASEGYMAYADPTQNVKNNNGIIYVGAVFPKNVLDIKVQQFDEPHSGSVGHVLGLSEYIPGEDFVYYWGSGWSKGGIHSDEDWISYLKDYARKVRAPLMVEIQ